MAIITVLLILGYIWRFKSDAGIETQIRATTLPKEDKAKYIIDEKRHELIEITHAPIDPASGGEDGSGTVERRTYLPPHASIELRKDGTVVVTARTWGTEIQPFVGLAGATDRSFTAQAAVSLLYVQRWEFGGGLSVNVRDVHDVRAVLTASHNFYSNAVAYVGIDNHKAVSVGVGLKF